MRSARKTTATTIAHVSAKRPWGRGIYSKGAHKLSRLGTLLDVHNELLLALLELCALAVELALRLCQRALVLAQTLSWRHGTTEERFLRGSKSTNIIHHNDNGVTHDDVHDCCFARDSNKDWLCAQQGILEPEPQHFGRTESVRWTCL